MIKVKQDLYIYGFPCNFNEDGYYITFANGQSCSDECFLIDMMPIEIEVPTREEATAMIVDSLEKKKERRIKEHQEEIKVIDEVIQTYLCLTNDKIKTPWVDLPF